MTRETTVRVLGGLRLAARYSLQPAEPDVGIASDYAEVDGLYDRRGRRAAWAEKRLTAAEWADVELQCEENA